MSRPIRGRAVLVGEDLDTDVILPGAYLNMTDPEKLGEHLLETHRDPGLGPSIRPGDILVAGRNCGAGSSREHAQLALLGRGVRAIVAAGFARIFLRNCINLGLPAVEHPAAARAIVAGETVEIDLAGGWLRTAQQEWRLAAAAPLVQEVVGAGGLVPWARARVQDRT